MIPLIILAFLPFISPLSFNNNFKTNIKNDPLNYQYLTPKWVYNDVYNHNKKYNKITRKFKHDNISISDEYQLIQYYKLPFGLLQSINFY
jgi:hypothetical protein